MNTLEVDPPSDLAALWAHAQEHLDSESAQRAFVEACVARQNLAFAAKCYRGLVEQASGNGDPRQRNLAEAQLNKLQGVALSLLKSQATPPPQFRKAATLAAVILCVFLLLTVALAMKP